MTKEGQQAGTVTSSVYLSYIGAAKSPLMVFFVALLFIVGQTFHSGVDFFVSIW